MVRPAEILIVGGGPAGSAAARLLSLWGHAVRLLTRPPTRHSSVLAESLPPSCGKLFAVLGIADAVNAANFVRSTGNTVWWGNGEARVERFAEGERGWQVTADQFAAVLLRSARDVGTVVEHRRVTSEDLSTPAGPIALDCSGRAGVLARARGWRVYEPAFKTVALAAIWSRIGDWPVPDLTQTLIESYAGGWMWSVPTSSRSRVVAAMVDPRSSNLEGNAARAIYLAEIAKAPRFSDLLADAHCDAGPWGFDASMYFSQQYVDDRVLVVGDAGSFVDPLSSAGVKKALASGWLAAVAAHTALVNPAMREVAFGFFADREREMYETLRAMTQRHLSAAAGAYAHPFWTDREFIAPERPVDVEAAFARLRAEPELRVRHGDVTFEDRPAVSGCEIVLEKRLVQARAAAGVRYLHDVDVLALMDLAPSHHDVGDLFTAYTHRAGPVALQDFLLALATALARQWLVWR